MHRRLEWYQCSYFVLLILLFVCVFLYILQVTEIGKDVIGLRVSALQFR